jgi:hypothetical protein
MILYFNVKSAFGLNPHIIFISIMKYIFVVAGLKFVEKRHDMVGFFNIYIGLVILIDIFFTAYTYMKDTYFTFPGLSKFKPSPTDFSKQFDDIIDSNFDFKQFNKELNNFNDQINSMMKKKSVKIIKKENSISEEDIKNFNKNVGNSSNQSVQINQLNPEENQDLHIASPKV